MPKKAFDGVPFAPVVRIEVSEPLSIDQLSPMLAERPGGVTICIRSDQGHVNRGGYYFHIKPDEEFQSFTIYNFEKIHVASLSIEQLVAFVNHCTGLAFNDWAFQFCQSVVNFRLDPE